MTSYNKAHVVASLLLLLTACNKAVTAHAKVTYLVQGNPQSALYPVDVRQTNEDVVIQLKQSAPVPEVTSVDSEGHELAFNFETAGTGLIVPAKFSHLRLRHKGDDTTDIVRQESPK